MPYSATSATGGQGRPLKKLVTNSWYREGRELHYRDRNQVIEELDGSENVMRQIYPVEGDQDSTSRVTLVLSIGLATVQ